MYLSILFSVALGLRWCTLACSSCDEWGLLFVVVLRLLIAVTSLVVEHGPSSCGTRTYLPPDMWNLPGPGIEPMSPTLAGRFPSTGPLGKSEKIILDKTWLLGEKRG